MKTSTRKALGLAALCACLGLLVFIGVQIVSARLNAKQEIVFALSPLPEIQATQPVNQQGINLNTATLEELLTLPGIGEHLAGQIIHQREIQPFHFLEDLRIISGFGDKRIDSLRGLAYVELPKAE